MTRHIYTYFEPLNSLDASAERELIELWKLSWLNAGWQPVVLTRSDAAVDQHYSTIAQSDWLRKGVNQPDYAIACFSRWCAFANAEADEDGFIFSCDYDVINFGFAPPAPSEVRRSSNLRFADAGFVPCLQYGRALDYHKVVRLMRNVATFKQLGARCLVEDLSDMTVIQDFFMPYSSICPIMSAAFQPTPKVDRYLMGSACLLVHFNGTDTPRPKAPVIAKALEQ